MKLNKIKLKNSNLDNNLNNFLNRFNEKKKKKKKLFSLRVCVCVFFSRCIYLHITMIDV